MLRARDRISDKRQRVVALKQNPFVLISLQIKGCTGTVCCAMRLPPAARLTFMLT